MGLGVGIGLSLYFWRVMLIRDQQKKLIQEHVLLGKIMVSTHDYIEWYKHQRLMHKRLLTADTLIFTVEEEHDQSAENSLSCPLNTDTGTDTHNPPSKWVIKPDQLTHVYHCTSKLFWRNSPHWPSPAHRHFHQTEPRTRGDFLQCEFRVHSWMRPKT